MKHKFKVEIAGDFYSHELYDEKGREVFDLKKATQVAEDQFGDEWAIVYNGEKALTRENVPDSWK